MFFVGFFGLLDLDGVNSEWDGFGLDILGCVVLTWFGLGSDKSNRIWNLC